MLVLCQQTFTTDIDANEISLKPTFVSHRVSSLTRFSVPVRKWQYWSSFYLVSTYSSSFLANFRQNRLQFQVGGTRTLRQPRCFLITLLLDRIEMKKLSYFLLVVCGCLVTSGCGPSDSVTVSPVDDSVVHTEAEMEEMAAQNASDMRSQ